MERHENASDFAENSPFHDQFVLVYWLENILVRRHEHKVIEKYAFQEVINFTNGEKGKERTIYI